MCARRLRGEGKIFFLESCSHMSRHVSQKWEEGLGMDVAATGGNAFDHDPHEQRGGRKRGFNLR